MLYLQHILQFHHSSLRKFLFKNVNNICLCGRILSQYRIARICLCKVMVVQNLEVPSQLFASLGTLSHAAMYWIGKKHMLRFTCRVYGEVARVHIHLQMAHI